MNNCLNLFSRHFFSNEILYSEKIDKYTISFVANRNEGERDRTVLVLIKYYVLCLDQSWPAVASFSGRGLKSYACVQVNSQPLPHILRLGLSMQSVLFSFGQQRAQERKKRGLSLSLFLFILPCSYSSCF